MKVMKIIADIENIDAIALYSDSAYQIDVLTGILLNNGYENIKITPASNDEIAQYNHNRQGDIEWNF